MTADTDRQLITFIKELVKKTNALIDRLAVAEAIWKENAPESYAQYVAELGRKHVHSFPAKIALPISRLESALRARRA